MICVTDFICLCVYVCMRVCTHTIAFRYRVPNHTRGRIHRIFVNIYVYIWYIACARWNFKMLLRYIRRHCKAHNSNPGKGGGFKSRLELVEDEKSK